MKLIKLTLRNFKGIKDFSLVLNGQDADVYGQNATGKSSIFDAWSYLLFGKDSQGQADFQIKTLDESGKAIPMIEHSVEAVLEINGKTVTLKKIFLEKWTRKRGSTAPEFTGHETEYYIDSVPVQKKQYDERISVIISERAFQILTNVKYFNEQLHWQDRRKILLDVCGDISDSAIIASDSKLATLPVILGNHSIDDYRKIAVANRAKINKDRDGIPTRIDEVMRLIPEVNGNTEDSVQKQITEKTSLKKEKSDKLTLLENGGGIIEKKKQLSQVNLDIETLNNKAFMDDARAKRDIQTEINSVTLKLAGVNQKIASKQGLVKLNNASIIDSQTIMTSKGDEWDRLASSQFSYQGTNTCAACGQPLPCEKVQAAREKAESEFNNQKANKLDTTNKDSVSAKARKVFLETQNQQLAQDIDALVVSKEALELQERILREKLAAHKTTKPEGIEALEAKQKQLTEDINNETAPTCEMQELKAAIDTIDGEVKVLNETLAALKQRDAILQRKADLEAEEKKLAADFEKYEHELFLLDLFIKTKVSLLTERINSKFEMARFKLFNELVNGGIEPSCEVVYQGVPYSSLNNGAKIQVGLDIIRTLSKHFGLSVPCWLDNRESVTSIPQMDTQIISLVVSAQDKVLRVETRECASVQSTVAAGK